MSTPYSHRLFAERALLADGWASRVGIDIGADGRIARIARDVGREDRHMVAGPLVPALANLHSHTFQRAMAGLAEVAGHGADSFWTWRDRMYGLVGLLDADDVEAIAARLFVETMKGGFGSIAEFHYFHHALGGLPYADPAEHSRRILAAATRTGIGLTLLPVFYAHSDFGGLAPTPGQARFIHDVDAYLRLIQTLDAAVAGTPHRLGLAFHSLRAATPAEIRTILTSRPAAGPVHIHVAEQPREVEACLAWNGRRPVRTLLDDIGIDDRWCLIHATHMDAAETAALAASGAVAGLCPATEANLGDGIFPAVAYRAAGGRFGIGTDSHVATGVAEEVRTLEYGQRLRDIQRNRLADGPGQSIGRSLLSGALAGGAQALGRDSTGIAAGQLADLVVLDDADPYIATSKDDQILDRWIFARGDAVVRDVMVGGVWTIRDRRHAQDDAIDRDFLRVLTKIAGAG